MLELPECCFFYSQVVTFGNADFKYKGNVLELQTFNTKKKKVYFILNPYSPSPSPVVINLWLLVAKVNVTFSTWILS